MKRLKVLEANLETATKEIRSHQGSMCEECVLARSLGRRGRCSQLEALEEKKLAEFRELNKLHNEIELVPKMGCWSTNIGVYGIRGVS